MLITLTDGSEAPRIQKWLIREGIASRQLSQGRLILIEDPFVPLRIQATLGREPFVLSLEPTGELPFRVLRRSLDDEALPFECSLPAIIAGPCSLESRDVALEVAHFLASQKLGWMRGGTYKARTSPYEFQGEGLKAATWLREACDRYDLLAVSEVLDTPDMEEVAEKLDLLQIGTRQMHDPYFLKRVGRIRKPVLLKRGLAATPAEWLWSAEYLLDGGAPMVIFCERGIRTASPLKRFTLDLASIPFIHDMTPYPVFVDPSHAAGSSPYVAPLALAAMAAGANGLLIEVHPDPSRARSDALQALDFPSFADLLRRVRSLNLQEVAP